MDIWTDELLDELEELAKLQFSISDIEILLKLPENALHLELQKKGKVHRKFKKGMLTAQMMVRDMEYNLAENGSATGLAATKANILGAKNEYELYE